MNIVRIIECPDRYELIFAANLELVDPEDWVGFSDRESAARWAEEHGYTVENPEE
jgi:hypothetical protein